MVILTPDEAKSAGKPAKRIFVAHEDAAARERALQFCDAFGRHEIHWCSFAALLDASQAATASEKAARADVIVFAGNPNGDFPDEAKLWIEQWLPKRRQREGALVGLISTGSEKGGFVSTKEMYLRHLAHRAGLDFLAHARPTHMRAMPDSLESYRQRAGQVTSVLDQILHKQTPPRTLV